MHKIGFGPLDFGPFNADIFSEYDFTAITNLNTINEEVLVYWRSVLGLELAHSV
jgi:hypothetical protein